MRGVVLALALLVLSVATPAYGSFHEALVLVPDREALLVMTGTTFNGLEAPNTPIIEAFLGERVRFTVLASEPHTFHLHGHPWRLSDDRMVDTFLVDVDTPHAFEVLAGGVDRRAGDWLYHCHIDAHLEGGMWGIFRVHPFTTRIASPGPLMTVHLDRLGEPLDGARLVVSVDGVEVPAHVEPEGRGAYRVHAALPPTGTLAVTATHPAHGMSVARAALGGGILEPLTFVGGAHGGHP